MRIYSVWYFTIGSGIAMAGSLGGAGAIASLAFVANGYEDRVIWSGLIAMISLIIGARIMHKNIIAGELDR